MILHLSEIISSPTARGAQNIHGKRWTLGISESEDMDRRNHDLSTGVIKTWLKNNALAKLWFTIISS